MDIVDDETSPLLGEPAKFEGSVNTDRNLMTWSITEKRTVSTKITLKWVDPVSMQIKTTIAEISSETPLQEVAHFVKKADFTKGWPTGLDGNDKLEQATFNNSFFDIVGSTDSKPKHKKISKTKDQRRDECIFWTCVFCPICWPICGVTCGCCS